MLRVTSILKYALWLPSGIVVFATLSSCDWTHHRYPDAQFSFVEPALDKFTNNVNFSFKVQVKATDVQASRQIASLEVFEGADCDPAKMVSSKKMTVAGDTAAATSPLADGKTYSARVVVDTGTGNSLQSPCSSSVGVDTQTPNPVTLTYPTGNGVVAQKEMLSTWTPGGDNGISGLAAIPYSVNLYGQAACTGPVLTTVSSLNPQYHFTNLTQGVTYSVQVTELDKAGNESVIACSPYTEVDVFLPGFNFSDATSSTGYSRVTTPTVTIFNDAAAAYWCFTSDTTFLPVAHTDPCPGGGGAAAGWYTSRPTTIPVPAGDGLKAYNLWIFRADGSLISQNLSSAAITLDQTPPGAFTVSGVGGGTDVTWDAYLTSSGQPEVKWTASTDVADYRVQIVDSTNAVVCSKSSLASTINDYAFTTCPALVDAQVYKVRITSFDAARNPTSAPDYPFTVDLDPPGSFSITGISGGADILLDHFFGTGNPTVNYSASSASTHYRIQIKDATAAATICTLGTKGDQSGFFDYATEMGVMCAGLIDGSTYKAFVSSFDDGENETASSNNGYDFQVDTTPPTLSIDSTEPALTNQTFANISFTASDVLSGISKTECKIDASTYSICISPISYSTLADGAHTFKVRATDVAGNFTEQTQTWSIDTVGPTTTILSGPTGFTPAATAAFSFSGTDTGGAGVASFECSLDGTSYSACVTPVNFASLSEGAHTVSIRAIDALGNVGVAATRAWTTDYTNPTLTITSTPANPSQGVTSAAFAFTATDASGILGTQCTIDGGAAASCSSPANYSSLAAGLHTFSVTATDNATHSSTQTFTWTIYTYSWLASGYGACSAAQPNWSASGFGACDAAQPAFTYDGFGGCSASCGGGVQYRNQYCSVVGGNQHQTVSCPVVGGIQTQSVQCQRNDSSLVADSFCNAGAKPATSAACSRGGGSDCAGAAPSSTQACTRGGGGDCNSAQATSQSCNTQACCAGTSIAGYCWYAGGNGNSCDAVCAGHGGYDPATINYGAANDSTCMQVLAGLGGSTWAGGNNYAYQVGCGAQTTHGGTAYGTNFLSHSAIPSSGSYVNISRACACYQ